MRRVAIVFVDDEIAPLTQLCEGLGRILPHDLWAYIEVVFVHVSDAHPPITAVHAETGIQRTLYPLDPSNREQVVGQLTEIIKNLGDRVAAVFLDWKVPVGATTHWEGEAPDQADLSWGIKTLWRNCRLMSHIKWYVISQFGDRPVIIDGAEIPSMGKSGFAAGDMGSDDRKNLFVDTIRTAIARIAPDFRDHVDRLASLRYAKVPDVSYPDSLKHALANLEWDASRTHGDWFAPFWHGSAFQAWLKDGIGDLAALPGVGKLRGLAEAQAEPTADDWMLLGTDILYCCHPELAFMDEFLGRFVGVPRSLCRKAGQNSPITYGDWGSTVCTNAPNGLAMPGQWWPNCVSAALASQRCSCDGRCPEAWHEYRCQNPLGAVSPKVFLSPRYCDRCRTTKLWFPYMEETNGTEWAHAWPAASPRSMRIMACCLYSNFIKADHANEWTAHDISLTTVGDSSHLQFTVVTKVADDTVIPFSQIVAGVNEQSSPTEDARLGNTRCHIVDQHEGAMRVCVGDKVHSWPTGAAWTEPPPGLDSHHYVLQVALPIRSVTAGWLLRGEGTDG